MYLEDDHFQCHPYFIENGDESILIDPGSMYEFDAVVKKVNSISKMSNIKYIILHHQDPDLAASVSEIEKLINREDLQIITHSRMIPLIKHYMVTSSYYEIDKEHYELHAKDLHLIFLTTPYCHSPGAFVSYEPETKTLFSGDIFGGVEESWEFYAKEDYFDKAIQFHAEYMPSRDIFNYALSKIEKLDLNLIAPQHGSVIKKEFIAPLIKDMKNLECGLYIDKQYHTELLENIEALKKKDIELNKTLKSLAEKDAFLFQKVKLADMGEMIGNIAHQWRQPLSLNSTIISIIKEKNQREELTSDELMTKLQEMEDALQYMSNTIDDFMRFFVPEKEKSRFSIPVVIKNALLVISPLFKKLEIELNFTKEKNSYVVGYRNEYTQVIISILSNAKDMLLLRKVENAKIDIDLYETDNSVILTISDNAGGIKEENLSRIFDPYFTTKHKSIGTGLGLYISKMIIEKNMNGELIVQNNKNGATFKIILDK